MGAPSYVPYDRPVVALAPSGPGHRRDPAAGPVAGTAITLTRVLTVFTTVMDIRFPVRVGLEPPSSATLECSRATRRLDPYPGRFEGRITYNAMMAVRQPRGGHCVIVPRAGEEPTSDHSSMEGSEDDGADMAWNAGEGEEEEEEE